MAQSTCSVDGCEGITGVPGTARGLCSKHYTRLLRHGDPARLKGRHGPGTGPEHPHWKGADASYTALHNRVYRRRGKASDHGCEHCGRKEPGIRYEWATVHGTDGTDVHAHYISLCVACHRLYDLAKLTLEDRAEIARRVAAGESMKSIAKDYGIHHSVISRGLNLRSPKWGSSKRKAS
jgi:Helix-turn-helix domain